MKHALTCLLLALPSVAVAGELPPAAKQEIAQLIGHLKTSDCQFNRNGTWYGPAEAADHLHTKYQYLLKKQLVSSAEDFIARAATESSMSGKPYQVKCGQAAPQNSGPWLSNVLAKLRGEQRR